MTRSDTPEIRTAEVVLPCAELSETLAFFTDELGFRLDSISPADGPRRAVLSASGLRVRLDRDASGPAGVLRLVCAGPIIGAVMRTAPNGTRVELVEEDARISLPTARSSLVFTRDEESAWTPGRAGMLYRDLIPDRQGGRYAASHIRIADGGPVPDYVHYHAVRFQMIYCYKGWVRVVYEDQGEPFVLNPGDCVLQPPRIRHRVLESSAGLEVIEASCPADHETFADHELELPSAELNTMRVRDEQLFVRHVAEEAEWRTRGSFEVRDTGIAEATRGLASVVVLRPTAGSVNDLRHDDELRFTFVLAGSLTLACEGVEALRAGDSFVIPAGLPYALEDPSNGVELLELSLQPHD